MKVFHSLSPVRFAILLIILCLVISVFTFGVAYDTSRIAIKETVRDELETFASLIAQNITGEEVLGFTPGAEETPRYRAIRDKLRAIRTEKKEIMNIYVWNRTGDDLAILVDDDDDPSPIGTVYEASPEIIAYTLQTFSGPLSDPDFTYEEWGASLSGYAPIRNSTGYPVAILGVDMKMEEVISRMDRVSNELLIIQIVGLVILILAILLITPRIMAYINRPKELFQQLFEHSADSVLIIQNGKIQEVNSPAEVLTGLRASELKGTDPFILMHPDDREQAFLLFQRIELGESTFETVEVRSNHLGESEKWLEIRSFPIKWKDKPAVLTIIRDISAPKEYQKALSESEERYAAIVNSAPEPVIIHKDGVVLFVNRAGEKASGYASEELVGTNILEKLTPSSAAVVLKSVEARRKGDPNQDYEVNFICKDGSVLILIVKGTDIIYQHESAVLVHLVDITERKVAEEALQKANQQLNLMTNITRHDILNGITALRGYLEIIEDDSSLLNLPDMVHKLQSLVFKIQEQIEFTRDYQTIGLKEPSWQNIQNILCTLNPLDAITLQVQNCRYEIYADLLLEKVFHNLLDNSVRHGEGVHEITISCIEESDELKIVYTDDGIGIPPEEKKVIFSSGWGKNTGYGLFLIREILSITNIRISETGESGKGARFEMIVPKGKFRKILA